MSAGAGSVNAAWKGRLSMNIRTAGLPLSPCQLRPNAVRGVSDKPRIPSAPAPFARCEHSPFPGGNEHREDSDSVPTPAHTPEWTCHTHAGRRKDRPTAHGFQEAYHPRRSTFSEGTPPSAGLGLRLPPAFPSTSSRRNNTGPAHCRVRTRQCAGPVLLRLELVEGKAGGRRKPKPADGGVPSEKVDR